MVVESVEDGEVVEEEAMVRTMVDVPELVASEVEVSDAEEADSVDEEEDEALVTSNCWDWARIPVFWGSVERKLTW